MIALLISVEAALLISVAATADEMADAAARLNICNHSAGVQVTQCPPVVLVVSECSCVCPAADPSSRWVRLAT